MTELNHYEILGVSVIATFDEIRKAYKKLCQKYHPDKDPDNEQHFMRIRKAWECLRDHRRKAEYDLSIKQGLNPQEFRRKLTSISHDITYKALNRLPQGRGHFMREIKQQLRQELADVRQEQGRLQEAYEAVNKHFLAIKEGQDTYIGIAFEDKIQEIKGGLSQIECVLAVLEFLEEDCERIVYEIHDPESHTQDAMAYLIGTNPTIIVSDV